MEIQTKNIFSPMKQWNQILASQVKNSHPINSEANYQICFACKKMISGEIKKPEWRWNLSTNQPMCIECYERKSKEFEKINNYCI